MNKIIIPSEYNYISAFLTFACGFKCNYCINKFNGLHSYNTMPSGDWIRGLNRIETINDRPITITGGEPTVYKDFYRVVKGIDTNISIDLLTNGDFDVEEFMKNIPPEKMMRKAKYASIRFSYHPGYTDVTKLEQVVSTLKKYGYSVGVWAVDNGYHAMGITQFNFEALGIDFRLKEYLDATHGSYRYPLAMNGEKRKCECKPSELLIAPDGRLFRCHRDLYAGENSYGHILDQIVDIPNDFLPCEDHGTCNPCDVKNKYNRFQQSGHSSVTIRGITCLKQKS